MYVGLSTIQIGGRIEEVEMLGKWGFQAHLWKDTIAAGWILLELEHLKSQKNAFKEENTYAAGPKMVQEYRGGTIFPPLT